MKKLTTTVLVRVLLAIIFAGLIAALKWEYFRWGFARVRFINTPFYPASMIFVLVLLFSALMHPLRELYRNKNIPIVQASVEKLISRLRTFFSNLAFQFVFWGFVLAIFMAFAWNIGLLRDRDYRFNQAPVPWITTGMSVEDPPVIVFRYFSRDNNQIQYLKNCARMARDLKDVGAKAILIPLPSIFTKQSRDLVSEINKTGVVVFGVRNESDFFLAELREREEIRVGRLSRDIYYRSPINITFVHEIDPFPYEMYPLWKNAHDVAFEILRLYYDIPLHEPIVREGDHLVFGSLRYPVNEKGVVEVGSLTFPNYYTPVHAGFGMDLTTEAMMKPPKFDYVYLRPLGKSERFDNLLKHRTKFEGKIVVVEWQDIGGLSMQLSYSEPRNYAQKLDNLIRGKILTQSNTGSILIGLLSIIGCGLILYRSKLIASVACLTLFSFTMLYGSAWLFQEKLILVDIPVAIASLVVSIAVFTVLRLGFVWRLGFRPGIGNPTTAIPGGASGMPGLALFRKKVSLSSAFAVGITLFIIVITAMTAGGKGETQTVQSPKEVVYVTSLPTVEVQGAYVPDKTAKQ